MQYSNTDGDFSWQLVACVYSGLCLRLLKPKKKNKNLKELGGFCKYCHEIQLSLKLTPEEWLASYLDLVVLTRSSLTTVGA